MTATNYRLATGDDAERLALLSWRFRTEGTESPDPDERDSFVRACAEFICAGIHDESWCFVVADIGGEIIANAAVAVVRTVPKPGKIDDRWGYLSNVYTESAHRGRGIGAEVIRHAQAWAKEHDLEFLIVWPAEGREAFYQRQGFRAADEAMEYPVRPHVD